MEIWRKNSGSITVMLVMVFMILFALVLTVIENARVLSASGYVSTAADAAAETVFGNYNKELFDTYHLLGYGGHSGRDATDLSEEITETVQKNLQTKPLETEKTYSDLYRICDLSCQELVADSVAEHEIFQKQITQYLKSAAVKDISDSILQVFQKSGSEVSQTIGKSLSKTADYEEGEYDSYLADEGNENAAAQIEKGKEKIALDLEEDAAGGNPLDTMKGIMQESILSLVCDTGELPEKAIRKREESDVLFGRSESGKSAKADEEDGWEFSDSMADVSDGEEKDSIGTVSGFLKNLMQQEDSTALAHLTEIAEEKARTILYAHKVFPCYGEETEQTVSYGLEHLIANQDSEKGNMTAIVSRIMALRMVSNFLYVSKSPILLQKSLATAMVMVGFTGLEPLIQAVQYTILLVLAFEESCIDVAALLLGKEIALIKNTGNFVMKYEQICLVSGKFFREKAKKSVPAPAGVSLNYENYLWLFLMLVSVDKLENRIFDLIEFDLQERCNQTFRILTCFSEMQITVSYRIPAMFGGFQKQDGKISYGEMLRKEKIQYAYTR